jgi:hypothetical protein
MGDRPESAVAAIAIGDAASETAAAIPPAMVAADARRQFRPWRRC